MDIRKVIGIILIILGLIFAIYPVYSAQAVSWIAGVALIAFGIGLFFDGFSLWSMMAGVSAAKILLGIIAAIIGFMFLYKVDALSFIIAYQFYIIGFILIFVGLLGIFIAIDGISRATAVLTLILGIICIICAFFSLSQPLYTAVIVGICMIMEGITFLASGIIDE